MQTHVHIFPSMSGSHSAKYTLCKVGAKYTLLCCMRLSASFCYLWVHCSGWISFVHEGPANAGGQVSGVQATGDSWLDVIASWGVPSIGHMTSHFIAAGASAAITVSIHQRFLLALPMQACSPHFILFKCSYTYKYACACAPNIVTSRCLQVYIHAYKSLQILTKCTLILKHMQAFARYAIRNDMDPAAADDEAPEEEYATELVKATRTVLARLPKLSANLVVRSRALYSRR